MEYNFIKRSRFYGEFGLTRTRCIKLTRYSYFKASAPKEYKPFT